MKLSVSTTAMNVVAELDAITFPSGKTGSNIRTSAVGSSNFSVNFKNIGPDILYYENGDIATTADGRAVAVGESVSVPTDGLNDLSVISVGTSEIRVSYSLENADSSASAGGGPVVLADPLSRGSYCVDKTPATFKVNMGLITMIENPADNTLFWPDDTLVGAFGVVLTIENEYLAVEGGIKEIEWTDGNPPLDNVIVGANATAGASGINGSRLFVRTHDSDGTTPVAGTGFLNCEMVTNTGVTFVAAGTALVSGFTTVKVIDSFASALGKVIQTATPTEIDFEINTWQPNQNANVDLSTFVLNTDPMSPAGELFVVVLPCGSPFDLPGAPISMNDTIDASGFNPCDQVTEYTNADISYGIIRLDPIGTNTTTFGHYQFGGQSGNSQALTVFSYDKN